jgi:hypothetical protein
MIKGVNESLKTLVLPEQQFFKSEILKEFS